MNGEGFNDNWVHGQRSDWDNLAEEARRKAEQSIEKDQTGQEVIEKLQRKQKAKMKVKRAIALMVMATAITAAGKAIVNHFGEKSKEAKPKSIQEIVEATRSFKDIDSKELIYFVDVTNKDGFTVGIDDNTIGRAEKIDWLGDVDKVEATWWESGKDMYTATDENGDGTWDTIAKRELDSGNIETKSGDEIKNPDNLTMQSIQSQFS